MKVYTELNSIEYFKAWAGGLDTLNNVFNEGKIEALDALVEEYFPEGVEETQLNDFLWFDRDQIYNYLDN